MFEMFMNSITLFLQGKLFQNLALVIRQTLIGVAIAAILLIGAVKVGLGLWLAVMISSLIAGMIQPWLFRNLKYR